MTTYRNVDEIRQLADTLDALPDDCGAYCYLAGWTMVNRYGRNVVFREGEIARKFFVYGGGPVYRGRGGRHESITSHAARLLGITPFEATILFGGGWRPRDGDPLDASDHHAAAKALRDFADGASIFDISWPPSDVEDISWRLTHASGVVGEYPRESDRSVVR